MMLMKNIGMKKGATKRLPPTVTGLNLSRYLFIRTNENDKPSTFNPGVLGAATGLDGEIEGSSVRITWYSISFFVDNSFWPIKQQETRPRNMIHDEPILVILL